MYTLLIADDDPLLLEMMAKVLAEPGYAVLTAADGFEAVRLLADRHIDLMIADINMPGLDGLQLGLQAKVMRPSLHILFMSGGRPAGAPMPNFGKLIEKPIRPASLIEVVRGELGS